MVVEEFVTPCASTTLGLEEMNEIINKFGSFVTIVTNKPISCVTLFLLIQKNPELKEILLELTDSSWYSVVEFMAHRYPILNKSKKIK